MLVAKHPFLDVLRISGQKKTLMIDAVNAMEKICQQMTGVVCRPLQKGAVSHLVSREIETFSIAVDEGGSLRFLGMERERERKKEREKERKREREREGINHRV